MRTVIMNRKKSLSNWIIILVTTIVSAAIWGININVMFSGGTSLINFIGTIVYIIFWIYQIRYLRRNNNTSIMKIYIFLWVSTFISLLLHYYDYILGGKLIEFFTNYILILALGTWPQLSGLSYIFPEDVNTMKYLIPISSMMVTSGVLTTLCLITFWQIKNSKGNNEYDI